MDDNKSKEVKEWFTNKYLDWEKACGRPKSVTEFSLYLGLKQASGSAYINGTRIPSYKTTLQICEKLNDYSLLDILDFQITESLIKSIIVKEDDDRTPPDIQYRLNQAKMETNRILKERGITGDMPEAEQITLETYERFGFKYTHTEIS